MKIFIKEYMPLYKDIMYFEKFISSISDLVLSLIRFYLTKVYSQT